MRDDGCVSSWPDHFLCDSSFCPRLTQFCCLDYGSNLSDHSPLSCSLNVTLSSSTPSPLTSSSPTRPRIARHLATADQIAYYCDMVSSHLPSFPDTILDCCDPLCTQHHRVLDDFCTQLHQCLHDSALSSLPKANRSSVTPGWNINARRLKEAANFWHDIWRQSGCPSHGVLHQFKRSAKSRYKYEVRRLRRHEQFIRRAAAIASSDPKSFWQLVHRINKSKSAASAPSVDGLSSPDHLSRLFSAKLQDILNSQDCHYLTSLSASLSAADLNGLIVSEECIDGAFAHLKSGKSDGTSILSDHLIHALPAVRKFLAFLFTSILRHGYMPESLRNCILVPIPKANKDPTLSDNYHPISLAPTLSKALEWCILLQFPQYFATSGLQFGFRAKMSTTLCTGTVKNVIAHYMHEGSSVFACFLDASKAFDLVNHEILFNRLLERDLPVHLARFLLSWYKDQRMSVRWMNSFSGSFPVSNGVRQGGVLSPILFTIYILMSY